MRRKKPHGATFLEMLFIIGLMPIAALIEAHLFAACMGIIHSSPTSQNPLLAVDRMTDALRRDVWNAAKLQTPDPQTILLSRSDGAMLTWKLQNKSATRSQGNAMQSWQLPLELHVQRQQSSITLSADSNNFDDSQQWQFISAILATGDAK